MSDRNESAEAIQADARPVVRPVRVEYIGPEGWRVWVDEDGTHVRASGGGALESVEFRALVELWEAAEWQRVNDGIPAPRVPDAAELRAQRIRRDNARMARQISGAVRSALGVEEGA